MCDMQQMTVLLFTLQFNRGRWTQPALMDAAETILANQISLRLRTASTAKALKSNAKPIEAHSYLNQSNLPLFLFSIPPHTHTPESIGSSCHLTGASPLITVSPYPSDSSLSGLLQQIRLRKTVMESTLIPLNHHHVETSARLSIPSATPE